MGYVWAAGQRSSTTEWWVEQKAAYSMRMLVTASEEEAHLCEHCWVLTQPVKASMKLVVVLIALCREFAFGVPRGIDIGCGRGGVLVTSLIPYIALPLKQQKAPKRSAGRSGALPIINERDGWSENEGVERIGLGSLF